MGARSLGWGWGIEGWESRSAPGSLSRFRPQPWNLPRAPVLLSRYDVVALDRPISGHILEDREWDSRSANSRNRPSPRSCAGRSSSPCPGSILSHSAPFGRLVRRSSRGASSRRPSPPPRWRGIELNFGPDVGPLRTWLISRDDVFIIQVQHDRFYLNWRVRQDAYPRFNDWDANKGLLSRFLREHEAFERFCSEELGAKLELQGIELAKIDHLERGRHWKDSRDLAWLLPMLGPALELAERDPVVAVRLTTPRDEGSVDIAIDTVLRVAQPPVPVVKLECRRSIRRALPSSELAGAFKRANGDLNELFVRLIPEDRHERFKKGWQP